MNGRMSKKVHKLINKKVRVDMEDLAETLSEERLYWRIVYAIRIIFKWNPKVEFRTKAKV